MCTLPLLPNRIDLPCPKGWWGNPVCGPCHCAVDKGFDPDCNKTNGQCQCKVRPSPRVVCGHVSLTRSWGATPGRWPCMHAHTHPYMCIDACTHTPLHMHRHTHTYMCIDAHLHVHRHTCTHTYMCIDTHTCTPMYICAHTCAHTYLCMHMRTHLPVHRHTCVHLHVHRHTYTCIGTYLHTHLYTHLPMHYLHTRLPTHTYLDTCTHTHPEPRASRAHTPTCT